ILLTEAQACLEPDQRHRTLEGILPAQLHGGIGHASRARVHEALGLEAAVAHRALTAIRQLLNGQAALEKQIPVSGVDGIDLGTEKGLAEGLILILLKGAVEVVISPTLVIAALGKDHIVVDSFGADHGRSGIVEVAAAVAKQFSNLLPQPVAGE